MSTKLIIDEKPAVANDYIARREAKRVQDHVDFMTRRARALETPEGKQYLEAARELQELKAKTPPHMWGTLPKLKMPPSLRI